MSSSPLGLPADEHLINRSLLDSLDAHEALDLSREFSGTHSTRQFSQPPPTTTTAMSSHYPDSLESGMYSNQDPLPLARHGLYSAVPGHSSLLASATNTGANSIDSSPHLSFTNSSSMRPVNVNGLSASSNSNAFRHRQHSTSSMLRAFSSDSLAKQVLGPSESLSVSSSNPPGTIGATDLPNSDLTLPHPPKLSLTSAASALHDIPSQPSPIQASSPNPWSQPQPGSSTRPTLPTALLSQSLPLTSTPTSASAPAPVNASQLAQLLQTTQPGLLNQLVALVGGSNTAQSSSAPQQEEISTIFVVGFPEDMTEREFQNMFTFCSGYEAATLKVPPKDTTANISTAQPSGLNSSLRSGGYGNHPSTPQAAALANVASTLAAANDPYNLVTVNSGGVLVDQGGHQATTAPSWQPTLDDPYARSILANSSSANDIMPLTNNPQPRKQIIGFAKFRTKQDALRAKDVLHGRRIDVEKGAVLKAEMAKKNLHTKRGVGAAQNNPEPVISSSQPTQDTSNAPYGSSFGSDIPVLQQPPINYGNPPPSAWRQQVDLDSGSRLPSTSASLSTVPVFDAAPGSRLESSAPSVSGSSSWILGEPRMPVYSEPTSLNPGLESEVTARNNTIFTTERLGSSIGSLSVGAGSNSSSSPPTTSYQHDGDSGISGYGSDNPSNAPRSTRSFSPPEIVGTIGQGMPGFTDQDIAAISMGPSLTTSQSNSTIVAAPTPPVALSIPLSRQGTESNGLTIGGGKRNNAADMNPPINTLYVGNLPSALQNTQSSKQLEDALTNFFSSCVGYRKLCFKQKTGSPTCFVEFDDVSHASRALTEMNGHTLGGLVKGGIRLSYSKNPLGVRGTNSDRTTGPERANSLTTSPTTQTSMQYSSLVISDPFTRGRNDDIGGPLSPPGRLIPSSPPTFSGRSFSRSASQISNSGSGLLSPVSSLAASPPGSRITGYHSHHHHQQQHLQQIHQIQQHGSGFQPFAQAHHDHGYDSSGY